MRFVIPLTICLCLTSFAPADHTIVEHLPTGETRVTVIHDGPVPAPRQTVTYRTKQYAAVPVLAAAPPVAYVPVAVIAAPPPRRYATPIRDFFFGRRD